MVGYANEIRQYMDLKRMQTFVISCAVLTVVLVVSGCQESNEVVTPREPVMSLTVRSLPHLRSDEGHYQLWATFFHFNRQSASHSPLHDSGFVSLGEFNVSEDGLRVTGPAGEGLQLRIPADQNAQLLNDIIITIQPHEEHLGGAAGLLHEEPGPAIMGGRFQGTAALGIADLTVDHEDAIGADFTDAEGVFSFLAPTSANPADSNSGVWFVRAGTPVTAGLEFLPGLTPEWMYEGWVIDRTDPLQWQYYSTGKFLRVDSADFDGAGSGKGPGNGLNFPGQDFITGTPERPDLTAGQFLFVITAEPVPDNSPQPFFLRILSSEPVVTIHKGNAAPSRFYNVAGSYLPGARVTVSR